MKNTIIITKLLNTTFNTIVDKIASNPTLRLLKQASLHGKNFKAATFISMAHRSRAVTKETMEYLKNKQWRSQDRFIEVVSRNLR